MICLECATKIARSAMAQPAVGCCTHCGAAVCLDHARYIPVASPPPGVIPQLLNGRRRVVCTTCDLGAGAGQLTISAFTEPESRPGWPGWPFRRGWSAVMSALTGRDFRLRAAGRQRRMNGVRPPG